MTMSNTTTTFVEVDCEAEERVAKQKRDYLAREDLPVRVEGFCSSAWARDGGHQIRLVWSTAMQWLQGQRQGRG